MNRGINHSKKVGGRMKIFYYTSTGNSLYVAKQLGGELYSIPNVLREGKKSFKADKIGFVIPSHFLGTPRIVKEFIEKVDLESDYIFIIMTYGNFTGTGSVHLKQILGKKNIKVSYANDILMVDNYIPMFNIENQISQIPNKKIDEKLTQIVKDVNSSKKQILKKSFIDKLSTSVAQWYYSNRKGDIDKKFIVSDECTSCKVCEKVCPVNNIVVTKKPDYKHNCDECLACIHMCPVNAISLKKEKNSIRYINNNVSLQEIIDSNI